MHPPPGPPRLPEGIRSARQVWSRLPAPPAKRSSHNASLYETFPRSTAPYATSVQAPKSGAESTVRRPRHRRCAPAGVTTFASVSAQRPSHRSDSTSPGFEPRVTAQPSLSTLSVGYTNVVGGCPPATPVRQQRRNGNHFRFAAQNARQCGSRSGLHRDVAAAESIPADPTKQEARVPSERRACRSRSHVKCSALRAMHLEDPEGSRRRPQPGRALPLEASYPAVDSRCLGHVAMPAAGQHAFC